MASEPRDNDSEPTPTCRSLIKMADDFETQEAREEAARSVSDYSSLALFALAEGLTPVQVRRRLLRFVAGVPLPEANGAAGVKRTRWKAGTPGIYMSREAGEPVVASIRRPTGGS